MKKIYLIETKIWKREACQGVISSEYAETGELLKLSKRIAGVRQIRKSQINQLEVTHKNPCHSIDIKCWCYESNIEEAKLASKLEASGIIRQWLGDLSQMQASIKKLDRPDWPDKNIY